MSIRDRIRRLEGQALQVGSMVEAARTHDIQRELEAMSDADLSTLEAFLTRAEMDEAGPEAALYAQCCDTADLLHVARGGSLE